MPIPFAALAGGAALLRGLGGLFGNNAKEKARKEEEQRAYQAALAQHGVREDARIQGLNSIGGAAEARGIKGINISPDMTSRRAFTGLDPSTRKESGNSTLGMLLGGAGDLGLAFADRSQQEQERAARKAEIDRIVCLINPGACPPKEQMGPTDDELGAGFDPEVG